ncbi:class I SAM-dependent methyltransferase [Planobispora takensis]|uniref:class I SAM-dependent methyltransferase n=1 Tax=Planobispora takensis TaxID=1367882 RepID=UPI001941D1B4|nr:methyltransferase domain-containing protein [Planobispora takensis]
MAFDVSADAYGRFMGRYSEPLAVRFAGLVDPRRGQRALDVGCGPGALAAELVRRLGPDAVCAVDPSEAFVAAARERLDGVDVRAAAAERLPFADATFDVTFAQLVVHFMGDPVAGLREMARVTRPAGVVAACVWDHAGDGGPLSLFWRAARDLDPEAPDESGLAGAREGHLRELFELAGLRDPEPTTLSVRVTHPTFEQWWEPFLLGVGPAGEYVAGLGPRRRDELRERCRRLLSSPPIRVDATAWTVRAHPPPAAGSR